MLNDELQQIWKGAGAAEMVKLEKSLLLSELDKGLKDMQRSIKQRDVLEIGAAVVMIPIFTVVAVLVPFLLSKVGAAILVIWMAYVIWKLRQSKKQVPQQGLSMDQYLLASKDHVQGQIAMLRSVAYWYLLPPAVGIGLFFAGVPGSLYSRLGLFGVIAALYIVIYYLNQRAVKKDLQPLADQIDKALSDMGK